MPLDVTVKPLPSPFDAPAVLLLHRQSRFRLLERSLQDFRHLERQLQLEGAATGPVPSVSKAIQSYCDAWDAARSFYAPQERGARLAFALEAYVGHLLARPELLASSLALKMFLNADVLSSHSRTGRSYRQAVQAAMDTEEECEEERVPAGCVVEHEVAVDLPEEVGQDKKLVLWKFASQGTGLVFSADFTYTVAGLESDDNEVDPYSSSEVLATATDAQDDPEVVHYRTSCEFADKVEDAEFVYGHFVVGRAGIVTMQWENTDTSSVLSKPVRFQAKVVPLTAAASVLEIADSLSGVDTAEWLHEYMDASTLTSLEGVSGWNDEGGDDGDDFGNDEDSAYDDEFAGEGMRAETEPQTVKLERRTHELEEKVFRLEETLTSTKKELKSALDRVQIAEEIYKANLETITQLESASISATKTPKPLSKSMDSVEASTLPPAASNQTDGVAKGTTQPEGTPPTQAELERVQRLCASFQEQCIWRSVESTELEAQLAVSQLEAASWREKHGAQSAQLDELETQNRTLRSHKKLLVQEVKRLQPYSQVNLAALVQDAQEARMVQRSLQAKLNSQAGVEASAETGSADFVLVEASSDDL